MQIQVLGVLAQIKAEKESVEALLQPVDTADRLFQEVQTLQKQVDDLEYKLDFRGQGVRTMEEIQLELNDLQSTKYMTFSYLFYFNSLSASFPFFPWHMHEISQTLYTSCLEKLRCRSLTILPLFANLT